MADLVESMKIAALGVYRSQNPMAVVFGEVISASPLQIQIEPRVILEGDELVLTRNVTDFDTPISYEYETEDVPAHTHTVNINGAPVTTSGGAGSVTGAPLYTSSSENEHKHVYKSDRQTYRVHNALVVGDKVILLRVQGGQRWVVLDRIGAA